MTTEPREPSRLPVRGSIAAVSTVGALALLLSFRGGPLAPDGSPFAADVADAADAAKAATDEPVGATPTATSGAVAMVEPMTVTGDPMSTRWGDVQVAVTLDGSDITEVVALVLPDGDRHSANISDYVGPILREAAIATDSADVPVISGATYTSEAYAQSLQSALDQAVTGERKLTADAPTEAPAADVPTEATTADVAVDGTGGPATSEMLTVTGDVVAIRWGEVQVAITLQGSDIVDVETLSLPSDDRRSQLINASAEPILREEAIASDSADISVVSGATYTSRAYAASLQSALDRLGA